LGGGRDGFSAGIADVNRGNLRKCEGGKGFEHKVKKQMDPRRRTGRDMILCDPKTDIVYIQYMTLRGGKWVEGELEEVGPASEFRSISWSFGVPGTIAEGYNQLGGDWAVVVVGGASAIPLSIYMYWYRSNLDLGY
jgi:hypothetical protein